MSLNLFSLQGKRILITGASSGIGRQVAITCSEAGAELILVGRNKEKLDETKSMVKGAAEIIVCDLTVDEKIAESFAGIQPVDGVVHGAGLVSPYPSAYLSRKHILETFNTNFIAPVLLMAFLQQKKKLIKNGSIVFISSISVEFPYEGGSMYAASKGALEAYSKSLALELVKQKIRSNCIAPALIKTPMYEYAEKNVVNATLDSIIKEKYHLGVGEPIDAAALILYLLSDAAKWVTGKKFTIDGGVLLSSAK